MAYRQSVCPSRSIGQAIRSSLQNSSRFVQWRPLKLFRAFLEPRKPSLFAVNAHAKPVCSSYRKPADPHAPDRSFRHPKRNRRIVFKLPSFNSAGEIRRYRNQVLVGHEGRKMHCVAAQIGDRARHSRQLRIETPSYTRVILICSVR